MNDLCNDNRFELIEKYKKKLLEATNIETSQDEMKVLDNILFRFWQMGWLGKLEHAQPELTRTFVGLVAKYIAPEICPYKEYEGKPYYSIKFIENGETHVGYSTYSLDVLSRYMNDYFILPAQSELEEMSYNLAVAKDEIDDLKERYRTLDAKYAGVSAANVCGEDERKKLIEENARLSAALKSEEEANDILTKRIAEANNEIDDLRRQYEMLQAKCNAVSGVHDCIGEEHKRLSEENVNLRMALECVKADNLQFEQRGKELTEENGRLTEQLAGMKDVYHRLYESRDGFLKQIEALERKVDELTTENEEMRTVIGSLTEYKDSWVKRCEKLKAEIDELHERNKMLRTHRNMAIRLLFCPPYSFAEIADELHIPTSLVKEIVEEGK